MWSGALTSERAYWVAWRQSPGVGPVTIRRLREHFGSLQAAWEAAETEFSAVEGWSVRRGLDSRRYRERTDPGLLLEALEDHWPSFWTPADGDYPPLLREIPDPPPLLFYRGPLRQLSPAVAVVGTRHPSDYGKRWASQIAETLAAAGFLVISGLAAGIDGIAHGAALRTGKTAAVLATSLTRVYPPEHAGMAAEIARGGLLLSEYAPEEEILTLNFPRRNRIVVGMSLATIVIEAPERSGALISAYLACDYNRELFALPGAIDTPQAQGCLKLISQGARVILGLEALLADLGAQLVRATVPSALPPVLDGDEKRIWDQIQGDGRSFDELALGTGLATDRLASALLTLELRGLLVQQAGSRYGRAL
jgi:DNA processing protein